MLILTRKPGESVRIGDDTVVTVLEVKGNHVRLGVAAPAGVRVHRVEVYERIREENLRSSGLSPGDFERIREQLRRR